MAAGELPAPGTEYGPCDPEASCGHTDCAKTVEEARSICYLCEKPIGYRIRFYMERKEDHPVGWPVPILVDAIGNPYVLVHADCLEQDVGG